MIPATVAAAGRADLNRARPAGLAPKVIHRTGCRDSRTARAASGRRWSRFPRSASAGLNWPWTAESRRLARSAASRMAVAAPWPPVGGIAWAASPIAVTRAECHFPMAPGSAATSGKAATEFATERSGSSASQGFQDSDLNNLDAICAKPIPACFVTPAGRRLATATIPQITRSWPTGGRATMRRVLHHRVPWRASGSG